MSTDDVSVCSYNEWDPLEEVIVGSVINASKMAFEPSIGAYFRLDGSERKTKGFRYSEEEVHEAEQQLDYLQKILEKEGVVVRRPDKMDHFVPVKTPDFEIPCGNSTACPRDVLLVVGHKIIEATMAQRARFFEYRAYRSLLKEYFRGGADWVAAPKPLMADALYTKDYTIKYEPFDADNHSSLTDFEPCFDAASFMRCGRDIFYQPDVVTNDFGADWLQRCLGSDYRIHRIKFADKHPPQHIDTTLVPIRPGVVLVNPERPCIDSTIELFSKNDWEIVNAPPSIREVEFHSPEVSNWISMNVLSIDEKKIIVEEKEKAMIKLLEDLDCEVITCPFDKVYKFGGGFHCCTLDVKRKGNLRSYFPSLDV